MTEVGSVYENTTTKEFSTYLYTYAGGSTPEWVERGTGGFLAEADTGGGS